MVRVVLGQGEEFNVGQLIRQQQKVQVGPGPNRSPQLEDGSYGDEEVTMSPGRGTSTALTGKRGVEHGLSSGDDGGRVLSVIAALEMRFAPGQSSDEEDMEDSAGEELAGGTKPDVAPGQNEVQSGDGDTSAIDNQSVSTAIRKKLHRKLRKANKEEQALLDDGKGFLCEDDYEEHTDALTAKMESELAFDGFFVHRGPLLSDERRAHFKNLASAVHTSKKKRKRSKPGTTNAIEKKAKLGKRAKKSSKSKNTATTGKNAPQAQTQAQDPTKKKKRKKKKQLSSPGPLTGADEISVNNLLARLTPIPKVEEGNGGVVSAAPTEDATATSDKSLKSEKTAPESSNSEDSQQLVSLFTKKTDFTLLSLAPFLEQGPEAYAFVLGKLGLLFPMLSEDILVKHFERVKLAAKVFKLRKELTKNTTEMKTVVSNREAVCDQIPQVGPAFWIAALESIQELNTNVLNSLYTQAYWKSKTQETSSTSTGKTWEGVLELFEKLVKEAELTNKTPIPASSKDEDEKLKDSLILVRGYIKRKCRSKDATFFWDRDTLQQLRHCGKGHKKLVQSILVLWPIEEELLGRRKTLCRSIKTEMKAIAQYWRKDQMEPDELMALTEACSVAIPPPAKKEKEKITVSEVTPCASAKPGPAKVSTLTKTKLNTKTAGASKPPPKRTKKATTPANMKAGDNNSPTAPKKGKVFFLPNWDPLDFEKVE
mmetsp:Transcript_19171/g.35467  ORF Transcript_19171/g.35467 Transcript_19171/m.35467 type:complete len:709 (-) Transcript_19171:168-2294(-)